MAKEIARWSGIVLVGGFALIVSWSLYRGLFEIWFHGKEDPFGKWFGTLFVTAVFALVVLPALWLTLGLLKRDYADAINALFTVAAVVVFLSVFQLLNATGLNRWLLHLGPEDGQPTLWSFVLGLIKLVLNILTLIAPAYLALATCRLGNRLARRFLRADPSLQIPVRPRATP